MKEACVTTSDGATLTILDSGKKGTTINWTVEATDESGNVTSADCSTTVVKK
jgi:hypothetical protein